MRTSTRLFNSLLASDFYNFDMKILEIGESFVISGPIFVQFKNEMLKKILKYSLEK